MRTVIFGLVFAIQLAAQGQQMTTLGAMNGRAWTGLSAVPKGLYVVGFFEGSRSITATIWLACQMAPLFPPGEHQPVIADFCKSLSDLTTAGELPKGAAYDDVVKGVDVFFSQPENLRFRVLDAIGIFIMRANGKSQAEIDRAMAQIRTALEDKPVAKQ